MTYDEAVLFIEQAAVYGSRPGLETITELLRRMDKPQDKLKIIHIAGTNGKGSTGAFISCMLAAAGYKVGRYISPAVFEWREKVQLVYCSSSKEQAMVKADTPKQITDNNNESYKSYKSYKGNKSDKDYKSCKDEAGNENNKDNEGKQQIVNDYISEAGVAATVTDIKEACEAMVREGFYHPTVFEIETAMAFIYLLQEQVDFAVIETGMGGRLDATNVAAQPLCCVISSISMDHMQYLGDSIEQISREKAGIIKKGVPTVTVNTDPRILGVLNEVCERMDSKLTVADEKNIILRGISYEGTSFGYKGQEYNIKLLGEPQPLNAILAIETINILQEQGYSVSREAILRGLSQTVWKGRFEIIATNPNFIIDGAHNEDAAFKLYNSVRTYFSGQKLFFIMGVFADKEYKKLLKIMTPLSDTIITITPPSKRALSSAELAKAAKEYFTGTIIDAHTVAAAIAYTDEHAKPEDVIVAFGSLSFLQEITSFLRRQLQDQIN